MSLVIALMYSSPPRAWAEINLNALRHNYKYALHKSNGADVMAVVKANAYGHGVEAVVKALEGFQPAFYGVANVIEAREVRKLLPKARIYLLGIANPSEYEEIVQDDYTPCVSCLKGLQSYAETAQRHNKTLRLHIAVDTGMGRGGFLPNSDELREALAFKHPNIMIEGIGSHLPVADEDEVFTKEQILNFEQIAPSELAYRHIANSAGLLNYKALTLNLTRPGLMLYGVSPLPEYQGKLKPVLTLKSRISIIRDIPSGHGISYGRTYLTTRDSKIATVGVGYADGYLRSLSGTGVHVWINGHLAPVIGRVTMDQIMVDVTDHPDCSVADEVELWGANLPVSEIAQTAGTIPWEILTRIAPRVQRITEQ